MVGTLLGMGAIVVALAGFGYQLTKCCRIRPLTHSSQRPVVVGVPLTLAWLINRALRRRGVAG